MRGRVGVRVRVRVRVRIWGWGWGWGEGRAWIRARVRGRVRVSVRPAHDAQRVGARDHGPYSHVELALAVLGRVHHVLL